MPKIFVIIQILSLGFLASCILPLQPNDTKVVPVVAPQIVTGSITVKPLPVKSRTLFLARGTEPFWALEQTATGAKFSRPDADGVAEIWYSSIETSSGASIIIVGTPISIGLPLRAVITPHTCSDGMSDIVYHHTVLVTVGPEKLSGCAD
jgi:uncharacterized membrane protein